MDPITAVGTGLAILGSRDILNRLLGPTADYIGHRARGLVEKCDINLNNVFAAAYCKLGDRIDKPGEVNPRVLKHIVDEGRFCDDFTAEYLGGILASSRVEGGRDDRGVAYATEISGMSSYQVRAHYLIYTAMLRCGPEVLQSNIADWRQVWGLTICFSDAVFLRAMDFVPNERPGEIGHHAFVGLEKRNLIGERWGVSEPKGDWPMYRLAWSTLYGFELYAWATGRRVPPTGSFFDLPALTPILGGEFDALKVSLGREQHG